MKNAKYSFNCNTGNKPSRNQFLLARTIYNALSHKESSIDVSYSVICWLCRGDRHSFSLQIPEQFKNKPRGHPRHRPVDIRGGYIRRHKQEIISDILNHLDAWLASSEVNHIKAADGADQVGRNLDYLFARVTFSENEQHLLEALIRETRFEELHSFGSELFSIFSDIEQTICFMLDLDIKEVAPLLNENSLLRQTGLILTEGKYTRGMFNSDDDDNQRLWVLPTFQETIFKEHENIDSVLLDIFSLLNASHLRWEDFIHLGYDAELVRKTVSLANTKTLIGINVLLYGQPGTGKTEFSKCLALDLDLSLVSIGENIKSGREPSREDRLAELRLAQTLFGKTNETLILVDEMDDLLGISSSDKASLLYIHRLLENNVVPVIWTTNNIETIPESILRRFTLAVKIGMPNEKTRNLHWRKMLKDAAVDLPEKTIEKLAFELQAPPGILANAIKTAEADNDSERSISHAARGLVKAVYGPQSIRLKPREKAEFSLELVNTDIDLKHLTSNVVANGCVNELSLCLYGAQGAGKSAFARQLADELGYEILQKRASDLLSPYVGVTEKKIAAAFQEAKETASFLFIDEADSLLHSRKEATRSWEITRVNEMLTWMECHDLPFACTTNLFESLDEAIFRRFTLKVEFMPLTENQVTIAFNHFFNHRMPEHTVSIPNLTPGDFATVLSKAKILNVQDQPEALVDLLEIESGLKHASTNSIGFN